MKKKFLLLSLITSILFICISSSAYADEQVIPSIEVVETEQVNENENSSPNFLLEVKWDTLDALNEKKNDFKITKDGKVGYLNADLKYSFLTDYDDIMPLGEYLKVKKEDKFGVIDISGREILTPEFEKISLLLNDDGREFLVARKDGKYRLFYNTGVIVPEDKLYTITNDSSVILARDIKPDLKKYIKNSKVNYEQLNNKSESYKIEEVKLPEDAVNAENDDIVDAVVKNTELEVVNLNDSLIEVGNKKFFFDKSTDKVGLKNSRGKQILSPDYDELTFSKPCKHYFSPVIIAKKGDVTSIYNSRGTLLAVDSDDVINVYRFGKVFAIKKSDENGNVYLNENIIGTLKKSNSEYVFKRNKFNIYPMHNITMLMITLLK